MDPMHFVLSDVKLLAVNKISNWLKLIEAHWCKRHVACNMASKSSFSLADRAPAINCINFIQKLCKNRNMHGQQEQNLFCEKVSKSIIVRL